MSALVYWAQRRWACLEHMAAPLDALIDTGYCLDRVAS